MMEADGRPTLPLDAVLDELWRAYQRRDDALQAIAELIIKHPRIEAGLLQVVQVLVAQKAQ